MRRTAAANLCRRVGGIPGGLLFAAGYVGLAVLTFHAPGLPEGLDVSRLIWLPSGLALAFIVQAGLRAWPWIFLAEGAVTVASGDPLLGALGTGLGSTTEAVLAAYLLGTIGFSPSLGRWRDVVALILLGAGVSSLMGSAVSVSTLVWAGTYAAASASDIGLRWWVTHANGILLLTPVVLTLCTGLGSSIRERAWEAVGIGAVLMGVGWVLFHSSDPQAPSRLLLYVPFPFLLWAAFRGGLAGAALANLVLMIPALAGTAAGLGPLAGPGPNQTVLQLGVFLVVAVLTSLVLAGVVEEREEEARARLAAEEERREMSERMHQAQQLESLGVLAGGIAHDFNNLLATIMGHTDLAEKLLPTDHPAGENMGEVMRASRRAADLCRQILAYAGRGQVSAGAVDVNEVVDEMGELLSVSFPSDARVEFHLEPGIPPIWGDVTQIRQVVLNLLTNAADALPGGKGHITVTTGVLRPWEVVTRDIAAGEIPPEMSHLVHLTVEDDGQGMDDELRARVLEPFFSTKQVGRGLGLAVVLGIVRSHGGCMELRTAPGKGARFRVSFPPTDRAVRPPEVEAVLPEDRPLYGKVLLADDEPGVRHVCRAMLEGEGLEVQEADDGLAAVERFREAGGGFDLVILDITMPRMDGYQALAAIRDQDPGARVILTTGNLQDAQEVLATWGVPLLAKPYGSQELRTVVAAALGRRTVPAMD